MAAVPLGFFGRPEAIVVIFLGWGYLVLSTTDNLGLLVRASLRPRRPRPRCLRGEPFGSVEHAPYIATVCVLAAAISFAGMNDALPGFSAALRSVSIGSFSATAFAGRSSPLYVSGGKVPTSHAVCRVGYDARGEGLPRTMAGAERAHGDRAAQHRGTARMWSRGVLRHRGLTVQHEHCRPRLPTQVLDGSPHRAPQTSERGGRRGSTQPAQRPGARPTQPRDYR